MRWREFLMYSLLAACGRVGFEGSSTTGDGNVTGDGSGTGGSDGGDPCEAGDGVCRVSCLAVDPDCTTTCGDGLCVGNAGESCKTCAECNTTAVVCGNGACEPSEDSDLCYADCGPKPWSWASEEQQMVDAINMARQNGVACPGGGGTVTASPLARIASLDRGVHEVVWEVAHQGNGSGDSCNGRNFLNERMLEAGASGARGAWLYVGQDSPNTIVAGWLVDMDSCNSLMSSTYTRIGLGLAADTQRAAAFFID